MPPSAVAWRVLIPPWRVSILSRRVSVPSWRVRIPPWRVSVSSWRARIPARRVDVARWRAANPSWGAVFHCGGCLFQRCGLELHECAFPFHGCRRVLYECRSPFHRRRCLLYQLRVGVRRPIGALLGSDMSEPCNREASTSRFVFSDLLFNRHDNTRNASYPEFHRPRQAQRKHSRHP